MIFKKLYSQLSFNKKTSLLLFAEVQGRIPFNDHHSALG
jgi:hypothetical protein